MWPNYAQVGYCDHYTNIPKLTQPLYENIRPLCAVRAIDGEDRGCKEFKENIVMCLGGECVTDR